MLVEDRKELAKRVSRGFDTLLEMERCGDTEGRFPVWFRDWCRLLEQYEAELAKAGVTA